MSVTVTYVGPTQGKPATWSQWVAERSQRGREVAERSQRTGFRSQRGRREPGLGRRGVAENQVQVAERSQRIKVRSQRGRRELGLGHKINPKVAISAFIGRNMQLGRRLALGRALSGRNFLWMTWEKFTYFFNLDLLKISNHDHFWKFWKHQDGHK